nr:hypothetical protein CFP56_43519 [Quercus suber]
MLLYFRWIALAKKKKEKNGGDGGEVRYSFSGIIFGKSVNLAGIQQLVLLVVPLMVHFFYALQAFFLLLY